MRLAAASDAVDLSSETFIVAGPYPALCLAQTVGPAARWRAVDTAELHFVCGQQTVSPAVSQATPSSASGVRWNSRKGQGLVCAVSAAGNQRAAVFRAAVCLVRLAGVFVAGRRLPFATSPDGLLGKAGLDTELLGDLGDLLGRVVRREDRRLGGEVVRGERLGWTRPRRSAPRPSPDAGR